MSQFPDDRGNWIILAILVLLASPVVFLIGLTVGSGVKWDAFSSASNLALWVSALSTLIIAVLTIVLAKETWHLRRIQLAQSNSIRKAAIEPAIDIYLERSNVAFVLMNVVVENSGSGPARNIQFQFSGIENRPLTENEQWVVNQLHKLNILKNGMIALGSDKSRKSYAFSTNDLFPKIKDEFFDIKIQIRIMYEDIEGDRFENVVIWDFSEYVGIGEVGGGDPTYQSVKELEKIAKSLDAFKKTSSNNRLKVDIYTEDERTKEREKVQAHYQAMKEAQQDSSDS